MFLVQSGSMETQFIQILLDVSDPRYTVKVSDHKKPPRCTENWTYFLLRATSCGHGWGILRCIKYFHTENSGDFLPRKIREIAATQMFSRRCVEHKKCCGNLLGKNFPEMLWIDTLFTTSFVWPPCQLLESLGHLLALTDTRNCVRPCVTRCEVKIRSTAKFPESKKKHKQRRNETYLRTADACGGFVSATIQSTEMFAVQTEKVKVVPFGAWHVEL